MYVPEFRTTYVSGEVTFHANERYDGTWSQKLTGDFMQPAAESIPVESVDKYKYLVGTNRLDPDNGLLYKVTRVVEENYRNQGKFIVSFRAQVLSDGRISTKCDKDAYHIRDIQKYYHDYRDKVMLKFPGLPASQECNGDRSATRTLRGSPGPVSSTTTPTIEFSSDSGGASTRRLRSNTVLRAEASLSLDSNSLPLFYANHVPCALCNLAANNDNLNEMNDLNPSLT